ncbi:hypothetical protein E2C01_089026 [Portunus trituberculatus]|uniref:Uncharacterized protein n=1 Tax=Portunus trituberculatus TaxID=210409 RepID=A0A5B7J7R5_PORTR|nr:hypothetical protein [Portunus trituberculatus]
MCGGGFQSRSLMSAEGAATRQTKTRRADPRVDQGGRDRGRRGRYWES